MTELAAMVEDMIAHPQNYGEKELIPPRAEDEGKYVLQYLVADWADPTDPQALATLRRLAGLEPLMREIVEGSEGMILDCYIALPSGHTLAMDNRAGQKLDEDGTVRAYDPTSRLWYSGAVEAGEIYFSPAQHSFFYDIDEVVFGLPVYVGGKLVAVLEGSANIEAIRQVVSQIRLGETGFTVVINDEAQIMYSPFTSGELMMDVALSTNVMDRANAELRDVLSKAVDGEKGFTKVSVNGSANYVSYAPLTTLGGSVLSFVSEAELEQSTETLLDKVDTIAAQSLREYADTYRAISILSVVVVILLIINAAVVTIAFSDRLVSPIARMTAANAGHDEPAVPGTDGNFVFWEMDHSIAMGAMTDSVYRDDVWSLKKGQTLFIYTDGVPEATDKDGNFFGLERMLSVLDQSKEKKPEAVLHDVKESVDAFAGDAPQFDDLTMMAVTWYGFGFDRDRQNL